MQKHLDDNQIILCDIELSNNGASIVCSTRLRNIMSANRHNASFWRQQDKDHKQ